jgi:tetratricopeptide (TPR) repeat protein
LDKKVQIEYFQKYIEQKEAKALAKVASEEKGIFPFFSKGAQANTFYFYNPKLMVQGQQKFLSTWGDRPNSDNWAIASAISSMVEQRDGIQEEEQPKNETFFVEKPQSYVDALPQTKAEIDSIKKLNQNAYLQLGMIYKESFKNYALAQDRLEHLIRLNLPGDIAAPALYHLYKINQNGLPQKAKFYFDQIVFNHPESPYAKILTNPEEFGQSDFQTPEKVYQSLIKIYQKGDFDQFEEKAESFRVLLSGTIVQPKYDLLMANFVGRLKGRQQWEKALKKIAVKYPESPEAITAQEIVELIKRTDTIANNKKIYRNYKWIFTFKAKDTASIKKIRCKLREALEETPNTRWFLSEDRFDKDQTYLVLHGIRNRRKLNDWKKRFDGAENEILNTNNFVILSADYKKILLDKIQYTNEKK